MKDSTAANVGEDGVETALLPARGRSPMVFVCRLVVFAGAFSSWCEGVVSAMDESASDVSGLHFVLDVPCGFGLLEAMAGSSTERHAPVAVPLHALSSG